MFFEKKKNNDFLSINIENLIDWNEPNGEGCIVSDRITKEGFKVGYMYREAPDEDNPDSGWRFSKRKGQMDLEGIPIPYPIPFIQL